MATIPNPDERPQLSVDRQLPSVTNHPALTDSDQQDRLRAEERLKLLTQAAQVYWWEWDCQTNLTRFSPNTEQIIGRPPAQAMPENLPLLHPDDRHIPRQAVEQAKKGGIDSFSYQVRCLVIPSEIRWLHVSGQLLRDAQGQLAGTFGTAQDITHHKQV